MDIVRRYIMRPKAEKLKFNDRKKMHQYLTRDCVCLSVHQNNNNGL